MLVINQGNPSQGLPLNETNQFICIDEIHRIANILVDEYFNISDPSLFSGKTAQILFLGYYEKMFPNTAILDHLNTLIDQVIDDLGKKQLNFNLVNGISGIHWGLKHVNKLYNNQYFDDEFLSDIPPLLEKFTITKLEEKNYDLLYGALGGYLSLQEGDNKNIDFHKKITEQLLDISTYSSNGKYWWIDPLHKKGEMVVNLGSAHGLPSIWYFIGLIYKNTLNKNLKKVLRDSIKTYKEFSLPNSNSQFPIEIYLDKNYNEIYSKKRRSSKLSWCYGDFCMAYGLIFSGKILEDQEMIKEGILIATETKKRNTLNQAGLLDPCLCHGTASCLHFYNKLYRETHLKEFARAAEHWFSMGLNYKSSDGYNLLKVEGNDITIYPYSLLDGITGIGLTYLSTISPVDLKWDKILVLS